MTEFQPFTDNSISKAQSSSDRRNWLGKLQILVTAILVPVFGIVATWQTHYATKKAIEFQAELEKSKHQLSQESLENQYKVELAKQIQNQLSNLTSSDPAKAKISLTSLYALAKRDEEKFILYTIAIVSDNNALRDTIYELIRDDESATASFEEKILENAAKRETAGQGKEGVIEKRTEVAQQNSVEKKLLQELTKEQDLIGWIYLGKVKRKSRALGSDKTIRDNQVPSKGDAIETKTSINLRSSAPQKRSLGTIKGIVQSNSILEVQDVKIVPINTDYDAVWAQVTQSDRN